MAPHGKLQIANGKVYDAKQTLDAALKNLLHKIKSK